MVQTTGKAFGSGSLSGYCTRGTGAGIAPRTSIASGSNIHCWDNLNDGLYGNSNSWIPRTDGDKAGVVLPAPLTIVGIQLARDLGGESGVYGDRAGGTITVEYSATANGDATPWASSSGWAVAGTVSGWAANTRNYYHFSTPVVADGLRITVTSGTCVDELEIYASGVSSTGPCKASGNCACSSNYDESCSSYSGTYNNNEECTVTFSPSAVLTSSAFSTESCCDELTVNGVPYSGSTGPNDVAASSMTWYSDYSVENSGWKICAMPN